MMDHTACCPQRGQFHFSVHSWYRGPIRWGHQPNNYLGRRVCYLDHRDDLARFGGECGNTWGVVWPVFGN